MVHYQQKLGRKGMHVKESEFEIPHWKKRKAWRK